MASLTSASWTSIDVGSTKVCTVTACASPRGLEIVGHGVAARSGGASDVELTARAIRDAVTQAERRSRLRVKTVYASLPRAHGEVLGRGASAALALEERESLVSSLERAGLSVAGVVASSLASAASALCVADRKLGAMLLDVGATTTDLAMYEAGGVVRMEVIDFGGATLTSELAARFGVSLAEAEFLKRNIGIASPAFLERDELVAVPNCSHGEGKAVRRRELARAIETRLEPLWKDVRRSVGAALPRNVVVTGGATLLQGFVTLAEARLARPVHRSAPFGLEGLSGELHSPCFSTAVGLARYVAAHAGDFERPSGTWGRRRLASA